jgi:hypothetical protein
MNYTIDTINKTITINEDCNMTELICELEANLRNWEEYTFRASTIIYNSLYPVYPPLMSWRTQQPWLPQEYIPNTDIPNPNNRGTTLC